MRCIFLAIFIIIFSIHSKNKKNQLLYTNNSTSWKIQLSHVSTYWAPVSIVWSQNDARDPFKCKGFLLQCSVFLQSGEELQLSFSSLTCRRTKHSPELLQCDNNEVKHSKHLIISVIHATVSWWDSKKFLLDDSREDAKQSNMHSKCLSLAVDKINL